ncbi:hypothetical protein [Azospirillum sp. A39]|uniref:hypothetical protein n=1 Tax=Azospirillum sp. A39 TaxID=3462279 RepID=UPI004045FD64
MLTHFRALVDNLVRTPAGLVGPEARDEAIGLAVLQYDKDRPRTVVEDLVTADGGLLELPDAWKPGFSQVGLVEHPVGRTPPEQLTDGAWRLYAAPTGLTIMFVPKLAAGATVRLTYTVPHQVDEAVDTIPEHHREAVACWAAAHLMDALAAARAGDRDPNLAAETTGMGDVSRSYAARAKALRDRYRAGIGAQGERLAPASASVAVSLPSSLGGPRFFPRRGL